MADEPKSRRAQVAALPYRIGAEGLEILLITSRDTGRWVIPKGGTMRKKTNPEAAALEAFEEAGAVGVIAGKPIGSYTYPKVTGDGVTAVCDVEVYPLAVRKLAKNFKEKGQRQLEWMTPQRAAASVVETALAELIRTFDPA